MPLTERFYVHDNQLWLELAHTDDHGQERAIREVVMREGDVMEAVDFGIRVATVRGYLAEVLSAQHGLTGVR